MGALWSVRPSLTETWVLFGSAATAGGVVGCGGTLAGVVGGSVLGTDIIEAFCFVW